MDKEWADGQKIYKINPTTRKILYKRGLKDQDIYEFLSWDLKRLPSLTQMHDMDKAARRIIKSLNQGESIGIYGDYDVDGTTSCALFHHFFRMLETRVELIQPSRFVEGYGLHPENVEKASKRGIKLLITVDCGITSGEACERALEEGMDIIITDHHKDVCETMPRAYAVVNPNRRDEPEDSPLRVLAGVGVAFAVCLRVRECLREEGREVASLYPLLQFVAIGTICDLVKLSPLNLRLVRHGLRQIPKTQFLGIRSFLKPQERKREMVSGEKLSFDIGPILNSKGRLDHPERALKLLIADDNHEAYDHYSHLRLCNQERKSLQSMVFKEAREQITRNMLRGGHIISIAYRRTWHEGIIGIVASKLVETFRVPALVLTNSSKEGILKGSARSVGEYDIFHALKKCEDLFIKFGGHRAAAGFSMPHENFPLFKERMESILKESPAIERTLQDDYDIEIDAGDITLNFIRSLELLEPFGNANPKPIFKVHNMKLHSYDVLKDAHVRWTFKADSSGGGVVYYKGISFNYLTKWGLTHPEKILLNRDRLDMSVYTSLGLNFFRGKYFVQLNVERIEY